MFIICDVLDTDEQYKFVVYCFGPMRAKAWHGKPENTLSTTAKGAMSFANGYISGIREMMYNQSTPYNVPEIFKTVAFVNALDKENEVTTGVVDGD